MCVCVHLWACGDSCVGVCICIFGGACVCGVCVVRVYMGACVGACAGVGACVFVVPRACGCVYVFACECVCG